MPDTCPGAGTRWSRGMFSWQISATKSKKSLGQEGPECLSLWKCTKPGGGSLCSDSLSSFSLFCLFFFFLCVCLGFFLPIYIVQLLGMSRKSERTEIALRLETRSQNSSLPLSQLCSFTARVKYSGFLICEDVSGKGQATALFFLSLSHYIRRVKLTDRHSVLIVVGVHWPPPLNDAMQRAQVPLGHRVAADPHVPALHKGTGRAGGACTAWGQAWRYLGLQERCWEQIRGSWFWWLAFKELLDVPWASVRSDPKYWSRKC